MLLTNLKVVHPAEAGLFVAPSYPARWQIDETIRFAKQAFRVGVIRLRRYDRLQNMIAIAAAAGHFVAVRLGEGLKPGILAQDPS